MPPKKAKDTVKKAGKDDAPKTTPKSVPATKAKKKNRKIKASPISWHYFEHIKDYNKINNMFTAEAKLAVSSLFEEDLKELVRHVTAFTMVNNKVIVQEENVTDALNLLEFTRRRSTIFY